MKRLLIKNLKKIILLFTFLGIQYNAPGTNARQFVLPILSCVLPVSYLSAYNNTLEYDNTKKKLEIHAEKINQKYKLEYALIEHDEKKIMVNTGIIKMCLVGFFTAFVIKELIDLATYHLSSHQEKDTIIPEKEDTNP